MDIIFPYVGINVISFIIINILHILAIKKYAIENFSFKECFEKTQQIEMLSVIDTYAIPFPLKLFHSFPAIPFITTEGYAISFGSMKSDEQRNHDMQ